MDALDMRILRRLGVTPFAQGSRTLDALRPARVAAALGTTRQTVEARLARLVEEGILQGYALWPNLDHLGLHWDIFHWRVPDEKAKSDAFAALPLTEGIVGVYSFLGPDLCVDMTWRSEEDRVRAVGRVQALVGETPPFTLYARGTPPATAPLTTLDWRILQALVDDARRPLADVAAEVGVSTRTVKRRVERMGRERAFDVTARVSLEKTRHPIPLAFLFHFAPGGGKRIVAALMDLFDDRCIDAWVPPSAELGNWDMSLFAESPGEIERLKARALAVPGVERVEVLLYTGMRVNERWLGEEIAHRAAA